MSHLHTSSDPRIFVFGSNRLGIHGAGAAYYAARDLGAERGVGEGMTGRTYALPTCSRPGAPLDLESVREHVTTFLRFADDHPELRFFVSEVGCGIAGFNARDIGPMFSGAPENCHLPPGWRVP